MGSQLGQMLSDDSGQNQNQSAQQPQLPPQVMAALLGGLGSGSPSMPSVTPQAPIYPPAPNQMTPIQTSGNPPQMGIPGSSSGQPPQQPGSPTPQMTPAQVETIQKYMQAAQQGTPAQMAWQAPGQIQMTNAQRAAQQSALAPGNYNINQPNNPNGNPLEEEMRRQYAQWLANRGGS
jgi:hypothetical protein